MWVMIPVLVAGTLPRMGCICADGTHKFFCQRHRQGNRTGPCVCCEGRNARADARGREELAASAGRHSCCRGADGKRPSESPELGTGRPCKPVVDRVEIVTSAKAALDLDRLARAPLFAAVELPPAVVAAVDADYASGESPPPPDLVTTLGVLLI